MSNLQIGDVVILNSDSDAVTKMTVESVRENDWIEVVYFNVVTSMFCVKLFKAQSLKIINQSA